MNPYFKNIDANSFRGYLIFLDVEGTSTHDGDVTMDSKTLNTIKALKKMNTVYLCSNRKKHDRNEKIAQKANIEYIFDLCIDASYV